MELCSLIPSMMTVNRALSISNKFPHVLDARMGSYIQTQVMGSRGACLAVLITTKRGLGCSEIKHSTLGVS